MDRSADRGILGRFEIWSSVPPWREEKTGAECWVARLTPGLERELTRAGMKVRAMELPPEASGWTRERVEVFSLVSKGCQQNPGDPEIPKHPELRAAAALPVAGALTPEGAPSYGSYYLPYDGAGEIASFPDRMRAWKTAAVQNGFAVGDRKAKVPAELLGGWPWDAGARRYVASSLGEGDPERSIAYIDIGWRSRGVHEGRVHRGPAALLVVTANQHARELVTFESAWRLAQRIVHAYAAGPLRAAGGRDEWGNERASFWRRAIDLGLHVLIVPTVNPSGYQAVTTRDWPQDPTGESAWRRTNGRLVDLNRNWPEAWLQGGLDAFEYWGPGAEPAGGGGAGTRAGSEPETQAVLQMAREAVARMAPELSRRPGVTRLPATMLDIHSSYGSIWRGTHVSPTRLPAPSNEPWLCGVSSDCLHPDAPSAYATFGNNARPGIVGTTGLAISPAPGDANDPALPYQIGHANYNIYPTSGNITETFAAPVWGDPPQPMVAATTEVTAYTYSETAPNPFGFGTCAPPDRATASIDEVVENLLPQIARMAEVALEPADVDPRDSALGIAKPGERFPFPRTRDIDQLGVMAELPALPKKWVASPTCTPSTDEMCFPSACNPQDPEHQCEGAWWTSFDPETGEPRTQPERYWALTARRPDPSAIVPDEAEATDVRLVMTKCAPEAACSELTRLRRGTGFDLFGVRDRGLGLPARITVQRELLVRGAWKAQPHQVMELVSAVVPGNPAGWEGAPDPTLAPARLEVASLTSDAERLSELRMDVPAWGFTRTRTRLGAAWPRPNAARFAAPYPLGGFDPAVLEAAGVAPGRASWASFPFTTPWGLHTYDFDLIAATRATAAPADAPLDRTRGEGLILAADDRAALPGFTFPAIFSATVESALPPICGERAPCCLLTTLGLGEPVLAPLRALRDGAVKRGPWARRYARAYDAFSPEVSSLAKARPELRMALVLAARHLAAYLDKRSVLDGAAFALAAARSVALLRRHGSPELRAGIDRAFEHLADLGAEAAEETPLLESILRLLGS
jgi:hypothetical protein